MTKASEDVLEIRSVMVYKLKLDTFSIETQGIIRKCVAFRLLKNKFMLMQFCLKSRGILVKIKIL
jgi:hypothetical protein